MKYIKEYTYVGSDEYPNTLIITYELLVCYSRQISNCKGCYAHIKPHIVGRVIFSQDRNNGKHDKHLLMVQLVDSTISYT